MYPLSASRARSGRVDSLALTAVDAGSHAHSYFAAAPDPDFGHSALAPGTSGHAAGPGTGGDCQKDDRTRTGCQEDRSTRDGRQEGCRTALAIEAAARADAGLTPIYAARAFSPLWSGSPDAALRRSVMLALLGREQRHIGGGAAVDKLTRVFAQAGTQAEAELGLTRAAMAYMERRAAGRSLSTAAVTNALAARSRQTRLGPRARPCRIARGRGPGRLVHGPHAAAARPCSRR